jgi:hypothetical protein
MFVNSVNDLDVHVNCDLNWSLHVNEGRALFCHAFSVVIAKDYLECGRIC